MKRKQFLSTLMPLALALPAAAVPAAIHHKVGPLPIPPWLQPGDLIAITSPGGQMSSEELIPCMEVLKKWGFAVKTGAVIGKRDGTLAGTDAERLEDLQRLLDDREVKAIFCARGGYGSVRIIDRLDWSRFARHPKWIVGFSDITVLHSHLFSHGLSASIHSKMCNSFPASWDAADNMQKNSILSIRDALVNGRYSYECLPHAANRNGTAGGRLVGGNLKTLESLAGTPDDIHTDGCLLFVEDAGEYLYSIDRMFWNLKRTGKLERLAGLIIGGFRVKPDDPGEEFGKSLTEIVNEKVKDYNYPVCFDFPVGHQLNNLALICGAEHLLTVSAEKVILKTD